MRILLRMGPVTLAGLLRGRRSAHRWVLSLLFLASMLGAAAQDGSLDAAFTQAGGAGFPSEVVAVAVQPDGKTVVGGFFGTFDGTSRRGVARLNNDGSLDPTFSPGTGFKGPNSGVFEVKSVVLQPDGKILVGGYFNEYNGTPRNHLVRINADGSVDQDFVPPAVINGNVLALAVQPDGKILVGGGFYTDSPATRYLMRLNADGSPDPSFAIAGAGIGGFMARTGVHTMALQPDGRIIVAGEFTDYNGIMRARIMRLHANGSLDASFSQTGSGIASGNQYSEYFVKSIALQRDGKVVAVGAFTGYNGIARRGIVRLNPDGTLDQTFIHPSGGFNNNANSVQLQPDGKIVVGGAFSSYGGVTRNRVARLNADGTLDASFNLTGSGLNQYVNAVALQSDGKIVAGGNFFQYNGAAVSRLLRLNNTARTVMADNLASTTYFPGASLTVPYTVYGTFNAGNVFTAQLSNASGSFASPVTIGTVSSTASGSISATIPANTPAGSGYRIRIVASDPALSGPDNSVDLTVTGPPSASIVYPGSPYCGGNGMALVTLNGTNGGTYSSTPGLVIDGPSGAINLVTSDPGNYTVTYTVGAFSTSTRVSIRPQQPAGPANQAVCAGSPAPGLALADIPGLQWNWTNTAPSIGLPASGSGDIPVFTALNGGTDPVSATISISASGGTRCSFRKYSFLLTVKPTPSLSNPGNQALCAGSSTGAVTFVPSLPGSTVSWTNDNTAIGLAAAGTGSIAPFTAVNNSSSVQTATISARAVSGGCISAPRSFTIQVSPSAGTLSYAGSPFCPSGPAYPARTGSAGIFTATPAGLVLDAATGQVNLALSQAGTYTVTNTVAGSGGCSSATTATLTIKPQATVNAVPNQVYCNGIVTAPIAFSGTAASFSWTNDNPSIGLAASGTGTSLPSFTTVNAGPATAYSYIKVTPLGDAATTCVGKPISFRIAVNFCAPVAQAGSPESSDQNARLAAQVTLSPNPARGLLTLQYSGTESGPFSVQLVDGFGLPATRLQTFNGTTTTIDLSGVRPGVYVLRVVNSRTGTSVQKQVIKL